MILSGYTSYITGLTHMAGMMSSNLSYSYIEAVAMDFKDYKKNFAKHFEIDEKLVELERIEKSINDIFYDWLRDSKVVNDLEYLIERCLGKEKEVYMVSNNSLVEKLSGYSKGLSGFYILEELFFVKYEKGIVCFMIGNNE